MSIKKFYVTTPIYYVTAKPHLGSLYSTVLADISAGFHRLRGAETCLLTGTDEHGQKVAQAAAAAGMAPKVFVDSFIGNYQQTWQAYHIHYDRFIRTTDVSHVQAVQKWLQNLIDQGDIYKATYQGWYCTPCETFVTEKDQVEGQAQINCASCGRATSLVSEEAYFFKLSAYQDRLLEFLQTHPNFILPRERAQEVINFVQSGLKDLCISRSTISWGIPFPGDTKHVTYVWADALNNYITAVGYGDQSRAAEFAQWWPADLQVMGKDIVRFHAVYWPAFLMASKLPLPKHLLVHGWIKVGDQKMSKSLGNVVDPEQLLVEYGPEPVRYYLASQIAVTHDSNFSINALRECISADLANNLGNLLSRSVSLALKNDLVNPVCPGQLSLASQQLLELIQATTQLVIDFMESCSYHLAVAEISKLLSRTNAYFHEQEPWKISKTQPEIFNEVIWTTITVLEAASFLLQPILPEKMTELRVRIGGQLATSGDVLAQLTNRIYTQSFKLQAGEALFMKFDKLLEEVVSGFAEATPGLAPVETNWIEIDQFAQVELLVGTIETCEPVAKSDKLLRMEVNFGPRGRNQVLSGVQKFFTPDQLIGQQGVFVFNLKPRKMMGLESQGMMLTVDDGDGGLVRATVSGLVPNGTKLK